MRGIELNTEVEINHYLLGCDAWEWESHEQAAFLQGLPAQAREESGYGLLRLQISHLADALKQPEYAIAKQFILDLAEDLKDQELGS